jgi:hypothetical protein
MTLEDLEHIFDRQIAEGTDRLYFMLVDGLRLPVVLRHPAEDLAGLLPMLASFEYAGAPAGMPRFRKSSRIHQNGGHGCWRSTMNERIRQLAKEAEFSEKDLHIQGDNFQKFAELIVRECISIVDDAERGGSNDVWDNAVKFIRRDLQEHFGVEE